MKNYERIATPEQLARLKSKLSPEKRAEEIKPLVRDLMLSFYQNVNEYRLRKFSEQLSHSPFSLEAIDQGIADASERSDHMPSISRLKDFIRVHDQKKVDTKEQVESKQKTKEDEWLNESESEFIKRFGSEKLKGFIEYWFKLSHNTDDLGIMKDTIMIFKKSALIDFRSAGYDIDKMKQNIRSTKNG